MRIRQGERTREDGGTGSEHGGCSESFSVRWRPDLHKVWMFNGRLSAVRFKRPFRLVDGRDSNAVACLRVLL